MPLHGSAPAARLSEADPQPSPRFLSFSSACPGDAIFQQPAPRLHNSTLHPRDPAPNHAPEANPAPLKPPDRRPSLLLDHQHVRRHSQVHDQYCRCMYRMYHVTTESQSKSPVNRRLRLAGPQLSGIFSEVVESMLSQRQCDLGLVERVLAVLDAPLKTLHRRGVCLLER